MRFGPVPRNTWVEDKIKRGFDGYASWAADAAHMSGARFIDLNTIAAEHYDALGPQNAASYFNDTQHTTKAGARLNADSVVEGLMLLKDCPLAAFLAGAAPGAAALADPKEIPVPPIPTSMEAMPGVDKLPNRPDMPDVLTMNNGQKVKTAAQWKRRREEMKRILEYYAVGQAPPAPGNVKGREISSQLVSNGKVKYRLVHLTFGPSSALSLDIGVFTPVEGGPFPTLISPSGSPPGAAPLPQLPQGPTQGKGVDVLLVVGPAASGNPPPAPPGGRGGFGGARTPEAIAAANPALAHGFAFVTFNNNDCGEDTTLRNLDGSWAFRTTRFYPAYPKYDWGLLQGWAWGVSRIVDYLETDPSIDKTKVMVTGVSRTGKSALVAGAFDDRLAMVAPVASSGGGTPAYRFSGEERGGKEGLSEMMRKYRNWFSPHLHEFRGQPDKLPFDEHWFIALAAPRPFIALEGTRDQNVNANGVRQSWFAALPAFALLDAGGRLGVNWSDRPHGMVQGDWDALLAFADKHLLGKTVSRRFEDFPAELFTPRP